MRRFLVLGLALLLIVPALFANGGGDESMDAGDKPVTLSVTYNWFGNDAHAAFMEWAMPAFEEAHPGITLELNEIPSDQVRQKVRADFMGGVATDLILWYGGAEAYDFVRGDWLMDLTDIIGPLESGFIPGALDNMSFDGNVYGLPLCQNFFAFYLNTEIYDEYGFDPPTNYEELKEQVAAFAADGLIPIMVPGKNHPLIQHFFSFVANQTTPQGAFEKAAYGEGMSFADEGFLKAAQIVEELQTMGAFDPEIDGIPMASVEDMFNQGMGAMYFAGIWRVGSLAPESRARMQPVLFPFVDGYSDKPNIATGQTEMGWVVNAESGDDPAKAAAIKAFIEWFADPVTSQSHVELTDTVVPVQKGVDLSGASTAVQESATLVANAESRPFLRYYMSPAQAGATNEAVWNLINGRISAEEAVEAMAAVEPNKR